MMTWSQHEPCRSTVYRGNHDVERVATIEQSTNRVSDRQQIYEMRQCLSYMFAACLFY